MELRGRSLSLVVVVAGTIALGACAPGVRAADTATSAPESPALPVPEFVEHPPIPAPVEGPAPVDHRAVPEPVEGPAAAEQVPERPPEPPPSLTDNTVDLSLPGALPAASATDAVGVEILDPLTFDVPANADVDKQMAYLHAHWNNYNGVYRDFNAWGGDCQNFVSQSLRERGWGLTWEWYYDWDADSWAAAWVHVPTFNSWLNANRAAYGATPVSFADRALIKVGDLVVFDWDNNGSLDHIQVVSRVDVVDGAVKIEMIGHNNDVEYRDLDRTITVEHPGATGWFWSLDY